MKDKPAEISLSDKIKVKCSYCKRNLGFRKGLRYTVKEGTIQIGQGRKKPYLNFCNRTCINLYELVWNKILSQEERIKKLEEKRKIYCFCGGDPDFRGICKECSDWFNNKNKEAVKKILERIDKLDWKMLTNEVFKFKVNEIIKSEMGGRLTDDK